MRIKMKIKHLLVALFGISSVASMFILIIMPQFSGSTASEHQTDELVSRLEDDSLSDEKRWKIIEEEIISPMHIEPYDIYKSPGSTEYQYMSNPAKEEIPYLLEYIHNVPKSKKQSPQNGYYTRAIKELAKYYWKKNDWEKADHILSVGLSNLKKDSRDYQRLMVQKLEYESFNDPDTALHEMKNIKPYEMSEINYAKLLYNQTRLLMDETKLEEAYQTLDKGLGYVNEDNYFTQDKLLPLFDRLRAWKQGEEVVTYEGTLETKDGKPIKRAAVFLVKPNDISSSMAKETSPKAITDEEGHFRIEAVSKGDYQIMLGLTLDQVNGYMWPVEHNEWLELRSDQQDTITLNPLIDIKSPVNDEMVKGDSITFQWEPVKEASSYELKMGIEFDGGGTAVHVKEDIQEESVTLTKEELLHQSFGVAHTSVGKGELKIVPESLLGLSNPNVDAYWYVEAYNKDGKLLSSSNGFRLTKDTANKIPYFHYEHQKLTEADQLLLDLNIDQALAKYKQNIKENPEDLHSLRMAYKVMTSTKGDRYEQLQDALPYLRELAQATNLSQYWYQLQTYAYLDGDWEGYFKYLQKRESDPEKWNSYQEGRFAIAMLKTGDIAKAEAYFKKSLENDGSHRFMPSYVMLKLYQNESFNEAVKLAKEYPERSLSSKDWSKRLTEIQKLTNHSPELNNLFQEGVEQYMSLGDHAYEEWVKTIENETLHDFFDDLE